jgi:hypothetical protein
MEMLVCALGGALADPSVTGSVVLCDPSQHCDQLSQHRLGRDWDVLGESGSARAEQGSWVPTVTNPVEGLGGVRNQPCRGRDTEKPGPSREPVGVISLDQAGDVSSSVVQVGLSRAGT